MIALRVKRVRTRTKRICSACETRVSPLSAQGGICIRLKRVRFSGETRSHEDLNAFAARAKRIRSTCETHLLYTLHLTGTVVMRGA